MKFIQVTKANALYKSWVNVDHIIEVTFENDARGGCVVIWLDVLDKDGEPKAFAVRETMAEVLAQLLAGV